VGGAWGRGGDGWSGGRRGGAVVVGADGCTSEVLAGGAFRADVVLVADQCAKVL
jgi:hypothetical protein